MSVRVTRSGLGLPDPLEVQQLRVGDAALLIVSGELDIARCPQLGVAINEVLRTRPGALIIDLCDVSFADSTALALLLNARRRTEHQGIEMRLACDVPGTLRVLQITRLDREFEVHASRAAALLSLRN